MEKVITGTAEVFSIKDNGEFFSVRLRSKDCGYISRCLFDFKKDQKPYIGQIFNMESVEFIQKMEHKFKRIPGTNDYVNSWDFIDDFPESDIDKNYIDFRSTYTFSLTEYKLNR